MHSRTILYFIIGIFLSGTAKSQQDNSFNFQLDGANGDFVTVSSNALIQPTTGMTLEAWVKPTEDPATYNMNGIVSYLTLDGPTVEAGFAFIYNSGEWRFIVMTGDNDVMPNIDSWPGIDIPFNGSTWTHIAGTYDGTTAKIFKNGIEEGSFNAPNNGGNIVWDDIGVNDFYIAKYQENYFKGSIDEVRLWEIVRTEAEIQAAMNDSITDDPVGLLGYWNFNDNQSNTIVDHTFNGVPGTLTNNGNGSWDTDVFASCPDFIIENLPYEHTFDNIGRGNDWTNDSGLPDSSDVAYKLVLIEEKTLFIDTCDPITDFDTILSIKDACYNPVSISLPGQFDDNNLDVDDFTDTTFCPEANIIYLGTPYPQWASGFDSLRFDPGTYYIIVDGYGSTIPEGNYKLAIGALPVIDTSYIASDDSYIEVVFSDPIYTNPNATGGAQINDLEIDFAQNGGNATDVAISTLTNTSGGGLVGGEDTIRINIAVTEQSSGVETVTIRPVNRYSIFNAFGIGLSRSSSVTANLNDYFPPNVNFIPANDTIGPGDNILLQFDEPIQLADGNTNPTDENIVGIFTLAYADTGTNLIPYVATVDGSDQEFTLNPDNILDERRTIATSFADNIFEDLGNNAIPTNSATFIVRDVTAATVTSDSLEQANQYIFLTISEGVYTNASGTGGLNTNDFEISSFTPGNATSANITSIASELGAILNGGETAVRLTLQFDNDP
nr:LamG domain-containing protein [Candidatus Neomarinimicrobiota bacterium]